MTTKPHICNPIRTLPCIRSMRAAAATLAVMASTCACAQSGETPDSLRAGWSEKVARNLNLVLDSLDRRRRKSVDTAYISRPPQHWTVKLRVNMSGSDLNTRGKVDGTSLNSKLKTDTKLTIGASISYRGLSLGFALNPAKLAGRNKDIEMNFNAYGNRIGGDAVIVAAKTYKGNVQSDGASYEVAPGTVSMKMITANGYYAFNHRRFSIPAAFTQSQIQRRSCGSWLAGLSVMAADIETAAGALPGSHAGELKFVSVAVGGGYGYNFVAGGKWLIHISAVPQLMVYYKSRFTIGDTRQHAPFRFPSITNVGRIAAMRYFGNRFLGVSAVVNTFYIGDRDQLLVENVKWRARLFYGFRF